MSFLAVTPSRTFSRIEIVTNKMDLGIISFSFVRSLLSSSAAFSPSLSPGCLDFLEDFVCVRFLEGSKTCSSVGVIVPTVYRSFSFVSPFHHTFAVSCSSRSLFVCLFVCWSEFVSPIRSFAVSCSSRGLFVDHGCLFVFYRKDLVARALLLLLLFFAAELLLFR